MADYWNERADELQHALLRQPRLLLRFFIEHASEDDLAQAAGKVMASLPINERRSVTSTLALRLAGAIAPAGGLNDQLLDEFWSAVSDHPSADHFAEAMRADRTVWFNGSTPGNKV